MVLSAGPYGHWRVMVPSQLKDLAEGRAASQEEAARAAEGWLRDRIKSWEIE